MKQLVAGLFISMAGVVEAPFKWQFDHFDDGMMAAMTEHLAGEDTILLGRVTYQEWFPYWPTSSDEPYASHINNTPKYVVSSTLSTAEWGSWKCLIDQQQPEAGNLQAKTGTREKHWCGRQSNACSLSSA